MHRSIAAVGPLILAAGLSAYAQAPASPASQNAPGEIRGHVVEAKTDQPIARASVSVRAKAGGPIITGAIAGDDGGFRLQGLRPGAYTLRTTYIGFTPLIQDVTISPNEPVVVLKAIMLTRAAVELAGVAVNAERTTMVVEPDRTTYRAKDVAPVAANASEVLDAVPSVQVDGDGKVVKLYRGNEWKPDEILGELKTLVTAK